MGSSSSDQAFEQYVQSNQNGSPEIAMEDTPVESQDAVSESVLSPGLADNASASSQSVIKPGSPQNRFIGAGILQRAADPAQGSGYVLMSPAGKVLADLKASGSVSLDSYVGQQVGVQGTRFSEQEKRDVIEVSALEPVQLRQ